MAHNSLSCASQKPGGLFLTFFIPFIILVLYSIIVELSFLHSKYMSIPLDFYCHHYSSRFITLSLLTLGDWVILCCGGLSYAL